VLSKSQSTCSSQSPENAPSIISSKTSSPLPPVPPSPPPYPSSSHPRQNARHSDSHPTTTDTSSTIIPSNSYQPSNYSLSPQQYTLQPFPPFSFPLRKDLVDNTSQNRPLPHPYL